VQNLIREVISVLWSTAYLDEAERCDTVFLLNEGSLLYQGPPQGLTRRVEGRTFKLIDLTGNRREVLGRALSQPSILDGIIQGSDVRLVAKESNPQLDLLWLLKKLGAENVTRLLVEGGGEVNASFLLGGLAQRVAFFYAPKILGGRDSRKAVAGGGAKSLREVIQLREVEWKRLGPDLLLTAKVAVA